MGSLANRCDGDHAKEETSNLSSSLSSVSSTSTSTPNEEQKEETPTAATNQEKIKHATLTSEKIKQGGLMREEKWATIFISDKEREKVQTRLFCFVHSGGNVVCFKPWAKLLLPDIEVIGIVYPGRGRRATECPIVDSIVTMGELLAVDMSPYLYEKPYSCFAHSLGTKVCFETLRALAPGVPTPDVVFMSASQPPFVPRKLSSMLSSLPDDDVIEALRKIGGTPAEILNDRSMMQYFLPGIRADFALSENYKFTAWETKPVDSLGTAASTIEEKVVVESSAKISSKEADRLNIDAPMQLPRPIRCRKLVAMAGVNDDVCSTDMSTWKLFVQQIGGKDVPAFASTVFEGDHFYHMPPKTASSLSSSASSSESHPVFSVEYIRGHVLSELK